MYLFEFRCSNMGTQHVEFVYVAAKDANEAHAKIPKQYKDYAALMTGKISRLGEGWNAS